VNERAFAGAGCANQSGRCAGLQIKVNSAENFKPV